jgi:hypothetical protein
LSCVALSGLALTASSPSGTCLGCWRRLRTCKSGAVGVSCLPGLNDRVEVLPRASAHLRPEGTGQGIFDRMLTYADVCRRMQKQEVTAAGGGVTRVSSREEGARARGG